MDRTSFIPGPEARQAILDAQGCLTVTSEDAAFYADEFIYPHVTGENTTLYQTMLACLSNTDRIEIRSGLSKATAAQEIPSGEQPGSTWAILVSKIPEGTTTHESESFPGAISIGDDEIQRKLWEVGRRNELLHDVWAQLVFKTYRLRLAAYLTSNGKSTLSIDEIMQGGPKAGELLASKPKDNMVVGRALSPSTLVFYSGVTYYYVDLGQPPVNIGKEDEENALSGNLMLSRPMRATEAMILVSLLALVYGAPPLVFGVIQSNERLGQMPRQYRRLDYINEEIYWPADDGDDIAIVI